MLDAPLGRDRVEARAEVGSPADQRQVELLQDFLRDGQGSGEHAEALLRERGYGAADALTRVFDGTGHNERDWAARVEIPLAFLLGPR